MTIKDYYLTNYPTDELGSDFRDDATFSGLLNQLIIGNNVYDYIGVSDSIIRERLFNRLSEEIGETYDYVYELWLSN